MPKLEPKGQSWQVMTFDLAHNVVSQKKMDKRRKEEKHIQEYLSFLVKIFIYIF